MRPSMIDPNGIARFRTVLLEWYRAGGMRTFPWRESRDPYAVLVGEVLLQRTRAEHVAPVYEEVLRRWPTYRDLGRARLSTIESVIRPLGLVKRAPILKRLGEALIQLGGIPAEPDRLEELPGVGRYAAHAVVVFTAERNLPVVDWVIARVLRRFLDLPKDRRPNADEDLWESAAKLADMGQARDLWLGTLDFASAVCKPRPLCGDCPLSDDCRHFRFLESVGESS